MSSAQPLEHVSFDRPDEVREGENWRLELVNLAGGAQVGRVTVQPGWKWSQDVKPVAGTDLCMAPHQQYQISGRIHVVMADGTEVDAAPVRSRRCLPGTTLGWSVTSRWWRSTGRAPRSGRARRRGEQRWASYRSSSSRRVVSVSWTLCWMSGWSGLRASARRPVVCRLGIGIARTRMSRLLSSRPMRRRWPTRSYQRRPRSLLVWRSCVMDLRRSGTWTSPAICTCEGDCVRLGSLGN